jgi:hypothetical protein
MLNILPSKLGIALLLYWRWGCIPFLLMVLSKASDKPNELNDIMVYEANTII